MMQYIFQEGARKNTELPIKGVGYLGEWPKFGSLHKTAAAPAGGGY